MEGDKKVSSEGSKPQKKDYSVLFELQDFLEKEVKEATPGAFYRSFVPLTDGLGLESPEHASEFAPAPKTEMPVFTPPTPPKFERKPEIDFLRDEVILEKEPSLSSVIAPTELPVEMEVPKIPAVTVPPPIPQPTSIRRMLAALIDQLFVMTCWAIALVITSNVYTGFTSGFSVAIFKDLTNPVFMRFALLEFAAIWICYFAICVGVLDLTFGMWVWHIRVSFGHRSETNYWMRKLMRVVWSFFFFAPVLPMLLLVFRRKGKNLLDVLSGTHLYVSA